MRSTCDSAWRSAAQTICLGIGATIAFWATVTPATAFEPRVPEGYFGVSAPELVEPARNADTALLERHAAAIDDAGLDWARITFDWRLTEPLVPPVAGAHVYDWSWTDRLVGALARNHVSVVPNPGGVPLWARDLNASLAGCGSNAAVAWGQAGAFGEYVEAIVRRYGRGGTFWSQNPSLPYYPVRRVEVWNEPNWHASWCPGPDPEAFAPVLEAAARGVRRADTEAEVVLGGLVTIKQDATFANGALRGMRTDAFLRRLIAAKPQLTGLIDTVGIHLYESDPSESLSLLGWLRRTLGEVGLGDAEMLITEFGWSTSGPGFVSEPERAANYRRLIDVLPRTDCGVSGLAAHSWFTFETDPVDPVHWFGIVNPDTAVPYPTGDAYFEMVDLWYGRGETPPQRDVINVCNATPPDQDGDGTPDEDDDFPFDPDRATGGIDPSPPPQGPTPEARTMPPSINDEFFGATDVWLPPEGPARQAHYDAMRDAGLGRIRQQLQWRHVESDGPDAPQYGWAETDRRVLALARRGIRMIPAMINAPAGVGAGGSSVDDSYAAMMGALADRYGSEGSYWAENGHLDRGLVVRDYEVWQAGNASWGAWDGTPSPAEYAQTYSRTRAAVRTEDPSARVIASLVDDAEAGDAGGFIRGMAQADPALRGGIDGVYVMAKNARTAAEAEATAADVRNALDATGNASAKLYVGFGAWTSGPDAMSEAARATMMQEIAAALPRSDCDVDGAFAFAWATRSEDPANAFDWYGIASLADASLSPSGAALRGVARAFQGYGADAPPRKALHGCFKQAPDTDGDGAPDAVDSHPLDPALKGTAPQPPGNPSFTGGPSDWSATRSATLSYSAARADSFQCRFDGGGWESCAGQYATPSLNDGEHSLIVRGVDSSGVVGNQVERRWQVDTRAPDASITSGPTGLVLADDVSFGVASDEPSSSFQCQLDSAAWQSCGANPRFDDVSEGDHVFRVLAVDRAGNTSTTYSARGFETRTIPRTPSILSITGTPGQTPRASFEAAFAISFECRYDEASFAPCSGAGSHVPALPLSHGAHRFYVRGIGPTGKAGPAASAPVSVVDARDPDSTISGGPTGTVLTDSVVFQITSDEVGARLWCLMDAGPWAPCPGDGSFAGLLEGEHFLKVVAVDPAGNADETPAERHFEVRTEPGPAEVTAGPVEGAESGPLPRFDFQAEHSAAMQCRFGVEEFTSCSQATAHVPPSPLSAGVHTFEVRGVGGTGKTGASAVRSFIVVLPDDSEPARCKGKEATIEGTPGPDVITGTARPDVIAGLGGADHIRGINGADLICAGDGGDVIEGGRSPDEILGGEGRDRCIGGPGRDRLNSCSSRDRR